MEQSKITKELKSYSADHLSLPEDEIANYSAETPLKSQFRTLRDFLDTWDRDNQQEKWEEAMRETLDKVERRRSTHTFLTMHSVFFRNRVFFSPVNLNLIREYDPDVIVNLIEDCYEVCERVRMREERDIKTGSYVDITDALRWRNSDILLGDLLSKQLDVPSYVVAVKHPLETFHRLLFERNSRLLIYVGFRMRDIWGNTKAMEAINEKRKLLHEKYCVFDPITIDEFLVKENGSLRTRWSVSPVKPVVQPSVKNLNNYEEGLKSNRLTIAKQITARDQRLVRQSDVFVPIRPFFGGKEELSTGVRRELSHALKKDDIEIAIYHPEEDEPEGGIKKGPLRRISDVDRLCFDNQEDLLNQLDKLQERKSV